MASTTTSIKFNPNGPSAPRGPRQTSCLKLVIPVVIATFALGISFAAPPARAVQIDGFTATGSMTSTRSFAEAVTLTDGKVLVIGGNGDANNSLELYNPATGTFSSLPTPPSSPSIHFTATLLLDGRVLIAGGASQPTRAFLFNPSTNTFSVTGNLITGRFQHTATRLPDGRVLITGGFECTSSPCTRIASSEIYDPITASFSPTGSLTATRNNARSILLDNGKVLVVGGISTGNFPTNSGELYDPVTGTFAPTPNMAYGRNDHAIAALRRGNILVIGGACCSFRAADYYDPATSVFALTGEMPQARWDLTANALKDGGALIAGGYSYNAAAATHDNVTSAERYNRATQQFTTTGSMTVPRSRHVSAALQDGRILICGGVAVRGTNVALDSCEIYTPDTIFADGLE